MQYKDATGPKRQIAYTYDANSNTATSTYSNSYKSSFTYDNGNRVTQHKLENTVPATLEQYDYGYSPGGLPADTWGYTRTEANGDVYLIAFDFGGAPGLHASGGRGGVGFNSTPEQGVLSSTVLKGGRRAAVQEHFSKGSGKTLRGVHAYPTSEDCRGTAASLGGCITPVASSLLKLRGRKNRLGRILRFGMRMRFP